MASPRELLPRWLVNHHHSRDGGDVNGAAAVPFLPPPHLTLAPWDDGFTPSGCDNRPCKIVSNQPKSTRLGVRVVDGAVRETTADLLYESAVRAKVWGVYVPTRELMRSPSDCTGTTGESDIERRRAALQRQDEAAMGRDDKTQYRKALARIAVEEFLVAQGGDVISREDWQSTHGVAVWVIASDCDDETEYHLDYAEMLRYETNVIFPPIYGATLHVSPLANSDSVAVSEEARDKIRPLDGGAFHVNTRGLAHYDAYGYKTRRAPAKLSTDDLEAASASEPGWQRVAYQYRRGIICDGELPHFSGRVRALPAAHKRVVVGFNLFPHEIGAFVEKFPEHSDAFNKHVKLSQTAAKQQQQRWTLESIKKNPKQAAFLKYLAKKVRQTQQLSLPQQSQPRPPEQQPTQQVPAVASTVHAV